LFAVDRSLSKLPDRSDDDLEESNTRRLGMVFAQAILPPANKADRKLPGGVNESIKSHKLAQKSGFSLRSCCC
jgi:hypothetical protein